MRAPADSVKVEPDVQLLRRNGDVPSCACFWAELTCPHIFSLLKRSPDNSLKANPKDTLQNVQHLIYMREVLQY